MLTHFSVAVNVDRGQYLIGGDGGGGELSCTRSAIGYGFQLIWVSCSSYYIIHSSLSVFSPFPNHP